MNNLSNAVLSSIVKLTATEYSTLTDTTFRKKTKGGVAETTSKLKPGEAFHVAKLNNIPSQAYKVAKEKGFKVAIRSGVSHIGQPGYWIVRKHA